MVDGTLSDPSDLCASGVEAQGLIKDSYMWELLR